MAHERSAQGLDRGEAAVLRGREKLRDLQAKLAGSGDLGRRHGTGQHRQLEVDAMAHDVLVKARAHDEARAGGDGLVDLLDGEHGARAHDHLGMGLVHGLDAGGGAARAERHLGRVHAGSGKGVGHRHGILDLLEHDNRHNAELLELLVEVLVHACFLSRTLYGHGVGAAAGRAARPARRNPGREGATVPPRARLGRPGPGVTGPGRRTRCRRQNPRTAIRRGRVSGQRGCRRQTRPRRRSRPRSRGWSRRGR